MSVAEFDVTAVRGRFPALRDDTAYFDGPGGSQAPEQVGQAMVQLLAGGVANRGRVTRAERHADDAVRDARVAMADLLGAEPRGVVFGRSMTQLTYDFARTLAKQWRAGDEVVVTSLDHDANIRPWVQAADTVDAKVRWAEFDPATGELGTDAVASLLTERTRVVAVTGASNLIGTRPDILALARAVHEAAALLYVDGVHLTPHAVIDMDAMGADFFACSPYKFLGPHLGVLAASPQTLERLHPDKLRPATDEVPERFELGTLPYELLAGTTAAVDFLAGLVRGDGNRRARLTRSVTVLEEHEQRLAARLAEGLAAIDGVRTYGHAARRTPTELFTVAGVDGARVHHLLAQRGVNAPAGSFYALECAERLGLGEAGGVRAGIAPYTNEEDVDRLLAGVRDIAATGR
ncbi:MAG: cysteine desulfurase-like protein [Streptosporangiales bacterium]|nr:cysteine desulfurase-like protein [Streptosporangiales bacterium]